MKPKHLDLLINVAATLVVLFIAGYVAWEALHTRTTATCSSRYPGATQFSLRTREGKPLSAIQLQARAGARDLGVVDNASVVEVAGGPSKEALQVSLRKLPAGADPSAAARNGIEFHWNPKIGGANSACLSYSILLSDQFPFGEGGFLPGVSAGEVAGSNAGGESISVGPRWDSAGKPSLAVTTGGDIRHFTGRSQPIPVNHWVKIEQELVLNEPGKENGVVRLWVDGTLVIDDERVLLRESPETLFDGVIAAVGYQRLPEAPGTLLISPFEIAWR